MKRRIHLKKLQPRDPEFFLNVTSAELHQITQIEISDLIRHLDLSKNRPKMLSSGLKQWCLIGDTVQVTAFRSLQNHFEQFFITEGEFDAFKNVEGLMTATNIRHKP
jgi:hypothetical protein